MPATADLATFVRGFFEQHLVEQRGLSPNTILAYRDTLKLFLGFVAGSRRQDCTELTLEALSDGAVRRFLQHLEQDRRNGVATRNARLAAIHAFFAYVAGTEPRHLVQARSILAVPFKRTAHRVPRYLERDEVQAIFRLIDRDNPTGLRDDALLRMLYNTGMRAQELADLNVCHVRFTRPFTVTILGKGRKERMCPLWRETMAALKDYLAPRAAQATDTAPLFLNVHGARLTRFGVRYIVAHRASDTAEAHPSLLARRVTPHTWRHTTAMHLLQSNVDLAMIRSWLGHSSIETTNTYVEIDLEMKRKTLRSCEQLIPKAAKAASTWKSKPDILAWLSTL
ncbi:MAG: site-specific integrase [Verrucomicrobiota bacterium]